MTIALGILILISAVFLVVAVLMQSGSSKRLSGSISGGAETFFGKNKGKTIDRMLGKLTNVVAIVFAVLVLASFLVVNRAPKKDESTTTATKTTAAVATTTGTGKGTATTGTAADKTTSASGTGTTEAKTTAASATETGASTSESAAETTQGTTASTQAE